MVVYLDTSFENEPLPAPQQCGQGMYVPQGWGDADVGDGGGTTSQMWFINNLDARAPPGGFPHGTHGIYGKLINDPSASTEMFLLAIFAHYINPYPAPQSSLYVRWYQMFRTLPVGSEWLPIFWTAVGKYDVNSSAHPQPSQWTQSVLQLILSGGGLNVSPDSDVHLNLSGAYSAIPPIQPLTWYKFEVLNVQAPAPAGRFELKINDVTRYLFTGNTYPTTGAEPNIYFGPLYRFEVGMQQPGLSGSALHEYWLDAVRAEDIQSAIMRALTINANIPAPVTLDGISIGNTPQTKTVTEGNHSVSVPQQVTV